MVAAVLRLNDIRKRDEGEAADIGRVERAVVGSTVGRETYAVRKRGELRSPVARRLLVRGVTGARAGDDRRRGLVRSVSNNLNRIGIQAIVGDCF